ncbi:hypothetical protein ILUMI_04006 [Ignelater luminosus]|uniref:PiggyBac transposable element-derived protein domain-containing protein n=1 Tax=Ignelater luminosus TaxID=2038154 RepID=A0A8K0DF65_IGNLU|nr:hypothetical protein ILUMI_04006 [Ignelater luminosus]
MKQSSHFTDLGGLPRFILDMTTPSPSDLFHLLIDDEVSEHIVFEINLSAEHAYQLSGKTYKRTDVDEIKTFIGINLLVGIKKLPPYLDHCSKLTTLHRFGWLLSNIHFNNNSIMT